VVKVCTVTAKVWILAAGFVGTEGVVWTVDADAVVEAVRGLTVYCYFVGVVVARSGI
jgi:hypothetical protein